MLSIADVEKQLAQEEAKKQKIKDEAKAKVAAAKAKEKAEKEAKEKAEKEKTIAAKAQVKINEKNAEAQKEMNKVKELDQKINDLNRIHPLTEKADKELKKLEKERSKALDRWSGKVQEVKGVEQTLSSLDQNNVSDEIHELSQQLLSKRLEEDMQKELDSLKASGKITDEKYTEMRAVIRGHKTVSITQSPLITQAVSQIDKYLTDYVNKQTKGILAQGNNAAKQALTSVNSIMSKEKSIFNDLKRASGKLQGYEKMKEKDAALAVTKSISSSLNKFTNLDKFFKSIDSSVQSKTGKSINSKKILGPVLGKINTNVGAKVSAKLQPFIKKHVKTIEKITIKVAKLQARIVAAEKAFKEAIKKYQDMATNFIKDQTKQLAEKVSKEIGINLGSALGKLGGSIKLGL